MDIQILYHWLTGKIKHLKENTYFQVVWRFLEDPKAETEAKWFLVGFIIQRATEAKTITRKQHKIKN